ncbi:MAG: hypothetical protein LBK94_02845 [Prevotellaceae bacterium]|jgi:hypothetical protein|nr:hypothetical protein [Prevotellaceae bacterium]
MKILKYYLSLAAILFFAASCEKNEITFTQQMSFDPTTQSAFQLHYMVNVTTNADYYITKVELNDEIIYRSNITSYNGAPGGAVGKFFLAPKGTSNLKLYQGTSPNYTLVYDNNFTTEAGQYYNVFVHAFDKSPVVINNDFPYIKDPVYQDSCGYVKFYNFLYETDDTPTTLRLQYERIDHFTGDTVPVGHPVSFGECTGWQPVVIKRPAGVTSGFARVDYLIHVIDADGVTDLGQLQVMNSSGTYIDYTDYWTCYIGRHYHHIFKGYRSKSSLTSGVVVWTAW